MKSFDWSRFKNYGLWVSIASLVPLVSSAFGYSIVSDKYTAAVNGVLTLLVALGILSNPTTDNKGYLDDTSSSNTTDSAK